MAGSLAWAGPAMTRSRRQRLLGDHLAEQDEVQVVQLNLAIRPRLQDLILGQKWICGHVAVALHDRHRDDIPVGVVSRYSRDSSPEDVVDLLSCDQIERVGDL